jgi:hypothetical protein
MKMSIDRLDQIAMALHDGWWQFKSDDGWTLGSRDDDHKKHPHCIAFASLPEEENRNQDRFQAAYLLQKWFASKQPIKPQDIHNAWQLWEHINGNYKHKHDLPYSDADAHGGSKGEQEHKLQAERVNVLLELWASS